MWSAGIGAINGARGERPGAIGSTQVFPGDDAAAQGDWVSTSGTPDDVRWGSGGHAVSGAWCVGVLTLRRSPHTRSWHPRVVPLSASRVVACAACVGRFRVQPGALVASGGSSASGG